MERVSANIITHNEEDDIRDCLESLSWAEEIVVVDAFSSDRTIEICKEFKNVKVYQNRWKGHINQKNFALSKSSFEWVLSLDADERLSPELKNELIELVHVKNPECNGYYMPRISCYLGRWIKHSGWFPDYQLRFFRKSNAHWGGRDPHDRIILDGKAAYLRGRIVHYPYRDLNEHLEKISSYTSIMAKGDYENGCRAGLCKMVLAAIFKFLNMYLLKLGFLDAAPGLIAAFMGGYYVFLRYAKLWAMNKSNKKDESAVKI